MMYVIVALIVLAIAVAAIYSLLKSMGEQGIEVAAPGSCRSGRCGVSCKPDPARASPDEDPAEPGSGPETSR